ncbi:kinase-like domain-containing protein [Rhizophagus irregularis DAOM 181602=DAOM 197198]|nr:kinase-like domain-containing protein [Rhizophagus irregularis DAOM 181602=DAOM 197198]
MKTLFEPSGNKIIDDFIKFTQVNFVRKEGKLEFVPYEQFKNIEFIAEGGFSKIYKATWVDGPINWDNIERKSDNISRKPNYTVVLKKINDSKNITSKELNELKIYYDFYTNWNSQHNNYQVKRRSNKISYQETPLNSCICNYFGITQDVNTQDFMIIMQYYELVIGDLGLSKSATESTDDNNVKYGRRPFWDEHHDTNLITKIRDGLRPPIVTNAPEGYIELMKECWDSDPCKRPTTNDIYKRICILVRNEEQNSKNQNPTKIIESSDIGPVPKNNPEKVKRKFEDNNDDGQSIKRKKLYENENNDIDMKLSTDEYITQEYDFDI